ncbi:MAG: SRPBCC family protein [Acidimicrobiia bacterium]|nr:SRPBCC family protein [Acidimicrobiia bacterium]
MRRISSSIEIAASPDLVWPHIAQFDRWPAWGLSITAVESNADQVAPGVTGRVRTPVGFWLPFTIEDVTPESYWDWRVAGVRATGHHLEPTAIGTRVRFTAPWIVAPYTVMMAASLRKLKREVEES